MNGIKSIWTKSKWNRNTNRILTDYISAILQIKWQCFSKKKKTRWFVEFFNSNGKKIRTEKKICYDEFDTHIYYMTYAGYKCLIMLKYNSWFIWFWKWRLDHKVSKNYRRFDCRYNNFGDKCDVLDYLLPLFTWPNVIFAIVK